MDDNMNIIDNITDESEDFRYSITSYGADYTVDSIVVRIEKEKIFVPSFQRKYVWTQIQASRFIESLILGLPVPGVFLSKEESTGRLLIIDGQQRMLSIANFYKGLFGNKKFSLKGVQDDLEGLSYDELKEVDKNRLDDSILHATVIKQDSPTSDESSIYMIFERLNTGGTILQPQEIRACVYYGHFNDFLSSLVKNPKWRAIFGNENPRMKEQELILRFFCLYHEYSAYKKSLKSFLNSFMANNRNFEVYSKNDLESLFNKTIDVLYRAKKEKLFRIGGSRINAAVFDSIMVGMAKRLSINPNPDIAKLSERYEQIIVDAEFLSYVESTTSSESSIKGRINMSIELFKDI